MVRGNRLALNNNKTMQVNFSTRLRNGLGEPIKFLGVLMDPTLTWKSHVLAVSGKISRNIYLLRNLQNRVSHKVLKTAYYGLVESHLSYAIIAWGHSCHLETLFKCQKRAIRVLCGLSARESVREKFRQLQLLTLPSIYILHCLLYIKENLHLYTSNRTIHGFDTRHREDIHSDFLRINKCRISVNYYAPAMYNRLSMEVRGLPYSEFKIRVSEILLSGAFYNIKEFIYSINNWN